MADTPDSPEPDGDPLDDADLLRDLYAQGLGIRKIADRLGTTRGRVYLAMKRHGIQLRPPGGTFATPEQQARLADPEWLRQRAATADNINQIARELGVTHHTLRLNLQRHGIDPPQPDPRLTLEWIREQRKTRTVADIADELGVSTKTIQRMR